MAYTTTDKVASYLQLDITSGTTPSTTDVEQWITEAEGAINQKVGHAYSTSSSTENIFSSNSLKDFWIPKDFLPLVSIDKLEINTGSNFDQTWVEKTEGTDFLIVDLITGHLKFSPNTTLNAIEQSVRMDLTYGTSSVPAIVTSLATKMAAKNYLQSALMNVSIETNEEIGLGPIRIKSDSSNASQVLGNLSMEIEAQMKTLGTTKSYIY